MCYDNVCLTHAIGHLPIGTKCEEVLMNMRTMKLKFNTGGNITVVQFNFDISEESLIVRRENEADSDFEDEDEENDEDEDDEEDDDN
jgi:hypothetical protein